MIPEAVPELPEAVGECAAEGVDRLIGVSHDAEDVAGAEDAPTDEHDVAAVQVLTLVHQHDVVGVVGPALLETAVDLLLLVNGLVIQCHASQDFQFQREGPGLHLEVEHDTRVPESIDRSLDAPPLLRVQVFPPEQGARHPVQLVGHDGRSTPGGIGEQVEAVRVQSRHVNVRVVIEPVP